LLSIPLSLLLPFTFIVHHRAAETRNDQYRPARDALKSGIALYLFSFVFEISSAMLKVEWHSMGQDWSLRMAADDCEYKDPTRAYQSIWPCTTVCTCPPDQT
jgi:hypothetical protein